MRPILLALSTFRYSEEAVYLAMERAGQGHPFVVVYVVDVNLARYFIGTDIGLYPEIRERCEEDLLKEHRNVAEARVSAIVEKAGARGIDAKTHIAVGRFALECLLVVEADRPGLIVTRRSNRPGWVRRLFGSPVDYLIKHAGCPVVEA